ncbi:hypothetical protein AAGL37_25545, partial [Klebsiella pneumoniae]
MKTEQLIPLCRRYHAMLLHSDEQTISIAVVNTPPAELMEALRFATQKRIDIECWSQEQMDKRLQAQEGGVSGNPRKFRHSALWNFLGGWSAA